MRLYFRGILWITVLLFLLGVVPVSAADLKQLMEIGSSQADMAKTLKQETKNYEAVKKAIDSGQIKKGMSADVAQRKYGAPIVETFDEGCNAIKWLYMPASSGHFSGEKLYLYIDKNNKVEDWELIEN